MQLIHCYVEISRDWAQVDSVEPYSQPQIKSRADLKSMAGWVEIALSLKGGGDEIFVDGLGAHAEEKSQEDNNNRQWDEPSSGGAVIGLSLVPDEVSMIEEISFDEEILEIVAARRH